MSLVNGAFPLLTGIDDFLAGFVPAFIRVCIWGIVSGSLTMGAYARLSPQKLIREKKRQSKELRQALLSASEADFDHVLALTLKNLKQSFALVGIVLGPALLSSVPVMILILWMSVYYGYQQPPPGTPVSMAVKLASSASANDVAVANGGAVVVWPASTESVPILGPDGVELTRVPHSPPVGVVHKRQWWNAFLGNEAGYIRENSPVEEISFDFERWKLLTGVPEWMATWEFPFLVSVFVWSLALKVLFRIE